MTAQADRTDFLDGVYDRRFSPADLNAKAAAWREIGRHLQRYLPSGPVLDIACDKGDFIRNVIATEKWASDLRDVSRHLGAGVRFVRASALELDRVLPNGYFAAVFASNYLEHLASSDEVVEQLRVVRSLLRPGGRLIVLQPNIRFVGSAYWDFIDHKVPLTDRSLEEAGQLAGLNTVLVVRRFLPYTFKSHLPSHPLLVRAYLALKPAWLLLGKQTLYVAEAPDPAAGSVTPRPSIAP